jgi:hypothetical protein
MVPLDADQIRLWREDQLDVAGDGCATSRGHGLHGLSQLTEDPAEFVGHCGFQADE